MSRILLFCMLVACNPVLNHLQPFLSEELKNLATDTLYLEKGHHTKNLDGHMVYLEKEGQGYLYTFKDYRLLQYAYPSGKLVASQEFEKEGPDGIGTWVSGHLIEPEEVFFISNTKELVQADHRGKVLQRYPLPEPPPERLGANYNTMNNNSMSYSSQRDELLIMDLPFVLKETHLHYKNWIVKLNLKNGGHEHLSFLYPAYYSHYLDDPELGAYFHIALGDQEKHLIGFAATDSMMVISNGESTWVDGGSSQSLKFLPGKTEVNGEWTIFSPNNESSRYKGFIHDPYQQKILRGVTIRVEDKATASPSYQKSFIVFDEKFKKTGEVYYTSNEFMDVGFATPNGLYLPLAQQDTDDETAYIQINFPETP